MPVKYSQLPSEDDNQSTSIDFSSYFTYETPKITKSPKYFSYSVDSPKYKSIFTYKKSDEDLPAIEEVSPGFLSRCLAALMTFLCYMVVFLTFPVNFCCTLKKIEEHERMVIYRLGRLLATKNPGYIIILPCLDNWNKVDVSIKAFSVPPMKIITSDGAIIELGGEVYYQVSDAVLSISRIQDMKNCMRTLCQTVMRNHISKVELHKFDYNKYNTTLAIKDDINSNTKKWGVVITKVELSPVKVIEETNALLEAAGIGHANPLSVLARLLPPGLTSNMPMQNLAQMGLPMPGLAPSMPQAPVLIPPAGVLLPSADISPQSSGSLTEIKEKITPQRLIEVVRPHLNSALVSRYNAVFKFVINGSCPGIFFLDLKHGEGRAGAGEPPHPADTTLTLTSEDLDLLYSGQLSGLNAYMSGRLTIDGDLHAAMAIQKLIASLDV